MKHFTLFLPLIFLLSIACLAQDSVSNKIDEYIRTEMQAQQIPGVPVAVIKNGQMSLRLVMDSQMSSIGRR